MPSAVQRSAQGLRRPIRVQRSRGTTVAPNTQLHIPLSLWLWLFDGGLALKPNVFCDMSLLHPVCTRFQNHPCLSRPAHICCKEGKRARAQVRSGRSGRKHGSRSSSPSELLA
ncbi:hypothetical protein P280DRAFT_514104 [Massarina eburnea CBS 473.64]|uniref:Uncharacterized protein n=1 Tax=Massarina eburnea CBS 473.64 TaxID=1395130 RepID=A0A6A6SEI8_9PLEO|nr:hypothetical protein P280DRAFT_514104 [Massarina eburnea CBS 473.64]